MDEIIRNLENIMLEIAPMQLNLSAALFNVVANLLSNGADKSGTKFKELYEACIKAGEKSPFKDEDIPKIMAFLDKWADIIQRLIRIHARLRGVWYETSKAVFNCDAILPMLIHLLPDLSASDFLKIRSALDQVYLIYKNNEEAFKIYTGEEAYNITLFLSAIEYKLKNYNNSNSPETGELRSVIDRIKTHKLIHAHIQLCSEYLTWLHSQFEAKLKISHNELHARHYNANPSPTQKDEIIFTLNDANLNAELKTLHEKISHVLLMRTTLQSNSLNPDEKLLQFDAKHVGFLAHCFPPANGLLGKPAAFFGNAFVYFAGYVAKPHVETRFLQLVRRDALLQSKSDTAPAAAKPS